jgi:hypothetical protein
MSKLQILAALGCWTALSALGCDDDGGDNQSCESGCAADYASAVDSCEDDATACMAGCDSPDDVSCMWDCEDLDDECQFDMIMCMSGCPCLKSSQNCIAGCGSEDTDCYMECSERYLDCAGPNSPYMCTTYCPGDKASCLWDCEETAADMDEYLECRADCHQQLSDCLADCI